MRYRPGALKMGRRVGLLLVVSSLIATACSSGGSPSDLTEVRTGHTATLLENGQVLVVGSPEAACPIDKDSLFLSPPAA